ncbi:MAG: TrkH family potassium uptake protein [Candidatus Krumholzibacteriia bacterium]
MNHRAVLRVLGFIAMAAGAAMLPPAGLAWLDGSADFLPLLISAGIQLVSGLVVLITTSGSVDLRIKDGFAIVTFGWLAAALFGALPYYLSGVCPNPINAFFESMSGFTTTGATIFTDIESLPRGLLLWRSLTQWLGGMGIVVLSVAVLPMLGIGGMQLFKAEVPGPTADRLSPRIQSTAKILWGVYVGMSGVETVLLLLGGMSLFDALCHTFCTVSTGGFSTRNASVGGFSSAYIDAVVTVFMFLAGANFSLHFWLLRRRVRHYMQNEEFRLYALITVVATLLIGMRLLAGLGMPPLVALRLAVFQSVSILTSTGFGTGDFLLWGFGVQIMLFAMMFCGGCAGSTGGGMKLMRVLVLAKHGIREIRKHMHPQAIFNVRLSGKLVSDDVMMRILGFFLLYMSVFILVAMAVAAMGVDTVTAFGASIATLSNIGPGLGDVGPGSTYAGIPMVAKLLLTASMLLGRLELFTVLILLTPMFWRKT